MGYEVELRACCGKLRYALVEMVESLPAGSHICALEWGPGRVPLNLELGVAPASEIVASILEETERRMGPGFACYMGRAALTIT